MKITFVSHSAERHGAELCLHELVTSLLADGDHEIEVICPSDGPLVEMFAAIGIEVQILSYGRWATRRTSARRKARLLRTNIIGAWHLARHFRRTRPDIVVTSTVTVPSAAIGSRLAGVPHLLHAMEFGVEAHDVVFHFGRTRSLRLLGVLSKVVVAVSNALAADLAHHVDPAKLRVVYHAAEVNELPAREPPDPDAPLQVAMLGYMSPGKGQDQAVQAIGKLRAQGVDARLALVGSGISSYVETLESICRELNVDDRVELIGFVGDERFRYFAAADVALCCSEHEGLPRVVIEAMKCGCAVIGARSGGTEELIDEGRTGYLYRPHDVSDLAAKLALVSQDRARTAALGANAAAWARTRFTRERYAADFLRAANDAVADGDCSPRGTA